MQRKLLFLLVSGLLLLAKPVDGAAQPPLHASMLLPDFFYQGDQPLLTLQLSSLGGSSLTGNLQLELTDAIKKQSVDGWFYNQVANQYFTVEPRQKQQAYFPVQIPYLFEGPLAYKLQITTDLHAQTLSGTIRINAAPQNDSSPLNEISDPVQLKKTIWVLPTKASTESPQQYDPARAIVRGQRLLVRLQLDVKTFLDSCILTELPSAGLFAVAPRQLLSGKPARSVIHFEKGTGLFHLYGLRPGRYIIEYTAKASFAGRYTVPGIKAQWQGSSRSPVWSVPQQIDIDPY